ncbi:MAG: chitobiase/beta-hexosaminidase C-terminal domain-containing protein [Phycisphaerae bacterium]
MGKGEVCKGPKIVKISLFSLLIAVFLTSSVIAKLCPSNDLNNDCKVDWDDIRIFTDQWLSVLDIDEDCPQPGCADLDSDSKVNLVDLAILSNQWLNRGIPLVINEFMASNNHESGIHDPADDVDNGWDDWVEIYNFGDTPINLAGMYLTDNLSNPTKWQVPYGYPSQTTVPADGFILFWADDETSEGPLHTSYKLSADGEEMGLFIDANTMVDGVIFGEQVQNISYGRYPDANDNFQFFVTPTPLATNNGAYLGFVKEIEVSHERGFYESAFDVLLTCDTNGAAIRYTLDGTLPTETVGTAYTPGVGIPITTTTSLRAIAYKAGEQPSRTAQTYIFIDDVAEQPNNPPGWPSDWGYCSECGTTTPSDYEMDPRVVDSTLPGYSIRDALLDIPTVSISMNPAEFIGDDAGLWANPQITTEYECSIEYIPLNSADGFQYECKIENHGGSSRRPYRLQKHNLRLTFTSQYGPAKLNYPLFPDSPVETFNQLLLRAFFTDSWALISWMNTRYRPNDSQYTRDVWMKESLRDMGLPSSYGNYVHLYVNGLYFGLYNLTELVGDDFFAEHLGGEAEDWTVNKDFASPDACWNTIMNTNVSTITGYTQALNYIDIENFADYMLLHFYADAEDWPSHNGIAATNAVSGDGKLRFFVWDQEIALDYHGRAAQKIDDSSGVGALFQKMRTSAEFRLLFADRFQKHCFNDGALNIANSQDRYLEIANMIDKAIVAESARWGDTRMKTPYGSSIDIPTDPNDPNNLFYPAPPHGPWPNYYFTREDSWIKERDCVINYYIPDIHNTNNSYALIKLLRSKDLYPALDAPVFYVNGSHQHGGHVSTSDTLTITDSCSTAAIYYTLDGTDPRVPGEVIPPETILLLSDSATKKARVPTGDIGITWQGGSEPYSDANWTSGASGIGYDRDPSYDPYIGIDVETAMYTVNTTCYIRIPFNVDPCDIGQITSLALRMRYDDGFIVYINGVEVERVNFTGTPVWNSSGTSSPEATSAWNSYDISDHINALHAGGNILAIHGLNNSAGSTDFLVCAELEALSGGGASDPTISPGAIEYTGGFNINTNTTLKARAYTGSTLKWSALSEADYEVDN